MYYNTLFVQVVLILIGLVVQTSYGRTLSEIVSLCQRSPGLVCDPDGILTHDQALQLNGNIADIAANTPCPCGTQICATSPHGYNFGLALIASMQQNADVVINGPVSSSNSQEAQKMNSFMQLCKQFAIELLASWPPSRCDDSVVIFISINNSMSYTATGVAASNLLTPDIVGEIAVKAMPYLRTNVTSAYQILLENYKLVLQGKYNRTTNMRRTGIQPETARVMNHATAVLQYRQSSILIVAAILCVLPLLK